MLFLAAAACSPPRQPELVTFSGRTMGTHFNVRAVLDATDEAPAAVTLEREVTAALVAVDDAMTTYRDSEVTRFNALRSTEPFALSPPTASVVALAQRLARATEGALDITVGPLVEALGFGAASPTSLPTAAELEALRQRVGYERLTIEESRLSKSVVDLEIDLSAIAKGFGVDRAAETLDRLGVTRYMVEVGGEVRARGTNQRGQTWRIGIERPRAGTRQAQRIIPLRDLAMATSGDYRNYREVDGRRISHLIDPRSGASIEHRVASATVLHPECAVADGVATAMMILGPAGLELAEANGWAVLLLLRDDGGFTELESSAFGRLVESEQTTSPQPSSEPI